MASSRRFFNFLPILEIWALIGVGICTPKHSKNEKKFFLIFLNFFVSLCKGTLELPKNHIFSNHDSIILMYELFINTKITNNITTKLIFSISQKFANIFKRNFRTII